MSDDLKTRLMMNWPSNPRIVVYDPIDLLFKEAHDRIEELEAKLSESEALLAKAVADMRSLVDVSTLMQSSASHNKFRHNTIVTDSIWSQWSKQLKFARTTLAELTGGKDG